MISLLAPALARRVPVSQAQVSPDEYAVYDAVIGDMFAGNTVTFDFGGKRQVKLLVIQERTNSYTSPVSGQGLGNQIGPSLHPETFADYQTRNEQPAILKRSFNIKMDYVLVNSEEATAAVEREGARGFISLSRVGLNRARNEAFVYMSYWCGMDCGHGFALFLVKQGDAWRVEKKALLWES